MTQSELILEYIDGTLDHASEQSLFDAMARQPEVRSALRQHLQIDAAVRADRAAFVPPVETEQALFAGLGLVSIPHESRRRGGFLLPAFLRSRAVGLVAVFLIGALLSGGGVAAWLGTDSHREASGNATNAHIPGTVLPPLIGTTTIPPSLSDSATASGAVGDRAASESHTQNAQMPLYRSRLASRSTYTERSYRTRPSNHSSISRSATSRSATTRSATTPFATIDSSSTETRLRITPVIPRSDVVLSAADMEYGISRDTILSELPHSDLGIGSLRSPIPEASVYPHSGLLLEARYGTSGDISSTHARQVALDPLENLAGGALYRSGIVAVGVELGVERYAQTLRYATGDTLLVEQRPRYFWGGVALRYLPGEIASSGIEPYLQATIGATSAGGIIRGRLGMVTELLPGLRGGLGVELSSLLYAFRGESLVSGRWGVSAGVEFMLPTGGAE